MRAAFWLAMRLIVVVPLFFGALAGLVLLGLMQECSELLGGRRA